MIFLKLPVDPNPPPQRNAYGEYSMVDQYIAIRSGKHGAEVKQWGQFDKVGDTWKMTAEVEFHNKSGQTYSKTIEFFVQNRALEKSKVVK